MPTEKCDHLNSLEVNFEGKDICEECVKTKDEWVHLRTCQSCGVTLCCDSSVNQHARGHFNHTSHPIITSAEPGEAWAWCYIDEQYKRTDR